MPVLWTTLLDHRKKVDCPAFNRTILRFEVNRTDLVQFESYFTF